MAIKSFAGVGGDFDDIRFCDSSVIDPDSGTPNHLYSWWTGFSGGKRFYVPLAYQLRGKDVHYNVTELTSTGRELLATYGSQYPNTQNFGRSSFDNIVSLRPMMFGKAVLATRTLNKYLVSHSVRTADNKAIVIGRHQIMMSAYRVEGLRGAIEHYSRVHRSQTGSEGAVEYLARVSEIDPSIVAELATDDGQFVVFVTALALARALLREKHLFGLPGTAVETTLLKFGPPNAGRGADRPKDSLNEVQDPRFPYRVALCPHPDNPFRWKDAA